MPDADIPGTTGTGSVGVMSITPFGEEGQVDDVELRRHLARFLPHPVSVYLCSQGSGEGLALTLTEKELIYRVAVEVLGGRREVVGAGIGLTGDTASAVEQVTILSRTGVDAVQVFPPRTGALRPTDAEIEGYFDEVAAAAGCPVVLGENVTLVGYEMGPPLIGRILGRHQVMTGLSYTAPGGLAQLTEVVLGLRDRVEIRTGWLHHLATMGALGAAGVLCFDGNLVPGLVSAAWAGASVGGGGSADELGHLLACNALLAHFGNPRSIKAALVHLGLPAGSLRRPFLPLGAEGQAELGRRLDALRRDHDVDRYL